MSWNGKRVVITGAEGFIGSHLAKRLVQEGALVHALVKKDSSLWRIEDCIESLVVLKTDITDSASLQSSLPPLKPQIVFHLAALVDVSRSWELMLPLVQTNIMGTLNLLLALKDCPFEAFIHTGSSEEYGDAPSPIPETRRESPISPYSFSKVAATHFCQMVARTFDLPVTVVRLFPVYGPLQDSAMFIPSAIRDLLLEKEFKMSPGEQDREFTYIDDVVEAYLRIAGCHNAWGQVINVGCGIPHKLKDVVELIRSCIEGEVRVEAGALPYRKGEGMTCYCNILKLQELTGWAPQVSLSEGLHRTVDWYKAHVGTKSESHRNY